MPNAIRSMRDRESGGSTRPSTKEPDAKQTHPIHAAMATDPRALNRKVCMSFMPAIWLSTAVMFRVSTGTCL